MAILWCGGEDVDLAVFTGTISTSTSTFRTGWARCSLGVAGGQSIRSNPFTRVTSGWAACRIYGNPNVPRWFGFIDSATGKGIFAGGNSSGQCQIQKWDGTTSTVLATESGTSLTFNVNTRVDIQVSSYGTSGTVNLYISGGLVVSYTGDISITGVTGFDSIGTTAGGFFGGGSLNLSEFIAASEDTRAFPGLLTMALTGAGTTDLWTGTFSNINGTTISDLNPASTNTVTQDEQFNLTDPPSGSFGIAAVKIAARAAKSATSTPTKISLGYNSGGTVAVGTAQALSTAYATIEQLDLVNPVTGNAFQYSELAPLQVDVRSVA